MQDKATVGAFVTGYEQMHRWRKMPDGSQVLLIGAQNFPFPIPLKKNDRGQWFFDTAAGREEILRRRIGRNELAVIDVCGALADAQADYYSRRHADGSTKQFALKFISDPGKQNGLYWESPDGQPKSPLGPLLAYATNEGYSAKPASHQPFHGYYFRMLTRQGSHAPGGAKDYVVGWEDGGRVRLRRLSRRIRQFRGDDIHHEPGWRIAPKRLGNGHHADSIRNDRIRS